jgi:hypothetical protein
VTAPYGSPARILAFGGVPGAIHCGDSAEVYVDCWLSDEAVAIVNKAEAVGIDVRCPDTSRTDRGVRLVATIRPEPPTQVRTSMRRMCDVMRPELDAGLAEVAEGDA